jgi:hypothetical protein
MFIFYTLQKIWESHILKYILGQKLLNPALSGASDASTLQIRMIVMLVLVMVGNSKLHTLERL